MLEIHFHLLFHLMIEGKLPWYVLESLIQAFEFVPQGRSKSKGWWSFGRLLCQKIGSVYMLKKRCYHFNMNFQTFWSILQNQSFEASTLPLYWVWHLASFSYMFRMKVEVFVEASEIIVSFSFWFFIFSFIIFIIITLHFDFFINPLQMIQPILQPFNTN